MREITGYISTAELNDYLKKPDTPQLDPVVLEIWKNVEDYRECGRFRIKKVKILIETLEDKEYERNKI